MRNQYKALVLLVFSLSSLHAHAIQINVQSTSSDIMALGFTVNGENHGGLGTYYTNDNSPKGAYTFGVRSHNNDVTCFTNQGRMSIQLNKSSTAILHYNGKACKVQIYPLASA